MDVIPGFRLAPTSIVPPPTARILIVDDEPRIRSAYRTLLTASGRDIDECATGGEAIAALGRQDIDILILDLNLPDISGREVMEWISRARHPCSIIVFSADDAIDSAILALRRGACEFIRKQADPDDLVRTVEHTLYRRRLEREHALIAAHLEQSERLHRFLVENSPDIIYTLDERGNFVFINSRIESLLGFSPAELLNQHYSTIVHPDDLEHARYAFTERRLGERATSNHEIRLRAKDRGVRHFENRMITAILSSQGIYETEAEASVRRFVGTSGVLRDITDRKRAEETIAFQAFHDQLTSLPNRVLFRDRLELALSQAKRRNQRVGLMFMDIDRFKLVNDNFGHAEGDDLLKNFARRVRDCLRVTDTLSRQGGDEFTVLLPDITQADSITRIAEKILAELKPPFCVGGRDFRSTVSIGIAIYPEDGDTPELLLRNADIAMYQIKGRGKNGYLYYTPEMSRGHVQRIDLDNELRVALERKQFELHYQPQISLNEGTIIGVEALIRWQHPERGMVGPDVFIPVAEETGLIFAISDWVLDTSCHQLALWNREGFRDIRMAINISPIEFERADFVERILRPIAANRVAPSSVEVEITESLLMDDAEKIIGKVNLLRQNGVRVSIDDFGTRYSSLNYLRRFAVNCVKIDQSFVRDLNYCSGASPVINAIVGIARGFGLNVLAEGVETDAQVQSLSALGCDHMQGFRFSPPLPSDRAGEFLRATIPLRELCRSLLPC